MAALECVAGTQHRRELAQPFIPAGTGGRSQGGDAGAAARGVERLLDHGLSVLLPRCSGKV